MTSSARLRGQARRTRMLLTGEYGRLSIELRGHIKDCGTCSRAGAVVYRRCEMGWLLTKLELRARRAVEKYDERHPENQGELF